MDLNGFFFIIVLLWDIFCFKKVLQRGIWFFKGGFRFKKYRLVLLDEVN